MTLQETFILSYIEKRLVVTSYITKSHISSFSLIWVHAWLFPLWAQSETSIILSPKRLPSCIIMALAIFGQKSLEFFLTFFCLYLMANFSLLRCIRSPCWNTGPVGSWLSNISNSLEDLVWSNKAVANFWHWLRSSWNEQKRSFGLIRHLRRFENVSFDKPSILGYYTYFIFTFGLAFFLYKRP